MRTNPLSYNESFLIENSPVRSVCILDSVGSTNTYAKNTHALDCPALILAYEQNKGRGRRNHEWESERAKDIIATLVIDDNASPSELLPLYVGYALVMIFREITGRDIFSVKYPNDVYANNRKIAGVLIERTQVNDMRRIIIGFGVNVLSERKSITAYNATSCADLGIAPFDENAFLARVCSFLFERAAYLTTERSLFIERINQVHYLKDKCVRFEHAVGMCEGVAREIDANGRIMIEEGGITTPKCVSEIRPIA